MVSAVFVSAVMAHLAHIHMPQDTMRVLVLTETYTYGGHHCECMCVYGRLGRGCVFLAVAVCTRLVLCHRDGIGAFKRNAVMSM